MNAAATAPAARSKTSSKTGNGRVGRDPYDLETVLAVAISAFNEYGYDATSISVLAERLGTSKSAIYYHVLGKEDLLRLALDRAMGELEKVLEEPAAIDGPAGDRLRFVVRAAVGVLVDDLPSVTVLLRVRGNTEVERLALERRRNFDHKVALLVDAARADGSLREDIDARTTTRLLFGMINSIVDWYRPGGPITREQLADDVLTVAFTGLEPKN